MAWLLASIGWLSVSAGTSHLNAIVFFTAALVCALVAQLLAGRSAAARPVIVIEPAARRLHGSFHQQSRPGVPGRIQARAPGCEH